jgi:hypothetical protein
MVGRLSIASRDLRLESGRIFEMNELVCLSIWKEHIPIDTRKYDEQIVLPTPSPSAGPA